ncbi:MAG: hypothetical protein Q9168_008335, partial [Polycauliona sp. 1 TL-2023]
MLGRVFPAVNGIIRQLRADTPTYVHRLLTTAAGRILLAFLLLYLLLIQLCKHAFYRDPTSLFFDPSRAYEHVYSVHRQQQADDFIQAANTSVNKPPLGDPHPTMCLGIATVERPGEQYVRSAIGSLMHGLTLSERSQIHTVILIGHTDPYQHPIYHEPWLEHTSDNILTYNTSNETQLALLVQWEKEKDYRRKAIFDYTYLLSTCLSTTSAPWIAMIEDDTLAVAGWYPRTLAALALLADAPNDDEWLYLRLFFTEKFFGWNAEFWPTYLVSSIGIVAAVGAFLLALRRFRYHTLISNSTILTICFIYTPALIILYFLAGRLSMRPLSPGVHEMPNYGCCAQGMVFSSRTAATVVDKLKEKESGFVDMILE